MRTITVKITKKHKAKAKFYCDHKHCLLATALRERFPKVKVTVGGRSAVIRNKSYWFSSDDSSKIVRSYPELGSRFTTRFPFTVTLVPVGG